MNEKINWGRRTRPLEDLRINVEWSVVWRPNSRFSIPDSRSSDEWTNERISNAKVMHQVFVFVVVIVVQMTQKDAKNDVKIQRAELWYSWDLTWLENTLLWCWKVRKSPKKAKNSGLKPRNHLKGKNFFTVQLHHVIHCVLCPGSNLQDPAETGGTPNGTSPNLANIGSPRVPITNPVWSLSVNELVAHFQFGLKTVSEFSFSFLIRRKHCCCCFGVDDLSISLSLFVELCFHFYGKN